MSPRDRPPVRTPSPRQPSGKDLGNQFEPSNLTFAAVGIELLCRLARGEMAPPTEPGFSQGFFLRSVTNGVLVPCCCRLWACLVGDTSFPAISLTWLNRNFLNWTELDDAITEFNNEMPLTENWVFNLVIYMIDTIFPILILCSCFVTICIVKSAI